MADLHGWRILVAEDEFIIADELRRALERHGAEVLGPVPTLARAMGLLELEGSIDAAVLDIDLDGEMVWPVADTLIMRHVPIVFMTGYEAGFVPPAYAHLPRCEKPVDACAIENALKTIAADDPQSAEVGTETPSQIQDGLANSSGRDPR